MIKIHCEKAFLGLIDIREHIVKKAIAENQSILVTCSVLEGESIYSPEELKKYEKTTGPFTSKIDGKPYLLFSYKWKKQENPNQLSLEL
jgi:hypothetical protein